jgi:hypothetical protein
MMRYTPPTGIIEQADALRRLADDKRAPAGEYEAAKARFSAILSRYKIDESALRNKSIERREFEYRHQWDQRLLHYVVMQITDNPNPQAFRPAGRGWHRKQYYDLTNAQYIDISVRYEFYRANLDRQMSIMFGGFILISGIHAKSAPPELHDMTKDDLEDLRRSLQSLDKLPDLPEPKTARDRRRD